MVYHEHSFPLSAFASVTVYGCSDTLRLLWAIPCRGVYGSPRPTKSIRLVSPFRIARVAETLLSSLPPSRWRLRPWSGGRPTPGPSARAHGTLTQAPRGVVPEPGTRATGRVLCSAGHGHRVLSIPVQDRPRGRSDRPYRGSRCPYSENERSRTLPT